MTITFSQPGRGPAGYIATGDPEYAYTTPDSATGRDLWGEMTLAAMDAVLDVAEAVIDDLGGAGVEQRLIVMSTSAGIIAASRWVETTT